MAIEVGGGGSERCGLCRYWRLQGVSEECVVVRDGVEEKIMIGFCELKNSQPDSECTCPEFQKSIEKLDDEEVQSFLDAVEEANEALIHFKTTGDRSKFKKWYKKYGGKNG